VGIANSRTATSLQSAYVQVVRITKRSLMSLVCSQSVEPVGERVNVVSPRHHFLRLHLPAFRGPRENEDYDPGRITPPVGHGFADGKIVDDAHAIGFVVRIKPWHLRVAIAARRLGPTEGGERG
jgi:hypothetical protein